MCLVQNLLFSFVFVDLLLLNNQQFLCNQWIDLPTKFVPKDEIKALNTHKCWFMNCITISFPCCCKFRNESSVLQDLFFAVFIVFLIPIEVKRSQQRIMRRESCEKGTMTFVVVAFSSSWTLYYTLFYCTCKQLACLLNKKKKRKIPQTETFNWIFQFTVQFFFVEIELIEQCCFVFQTIEQTDIYSAGRDNRHIHS